MIQMASFYKKLQQDNLIAGGIGQGGGGYWQNAVGVRLQVHIAAELGANLFLRSRPHGVDSFDRVPYNIDGGPYDLAYCQLFEVSHERAAEWIYTIVSDYISMEGVLEDFLDQMRPNVLISFQYPLHPPGDRPNLVEQCERYDCKVVFLPWFNESNISNQQKVRDINAMCTGKMGGTYPFRDAVYWKLDSIKKHQPEAYNIVLSGNPHGSTFPLSNEAYRDSLHRCQYYITGGIYDLQIPPKYYEVCNYGATLVSPKLPMMKEAGFIDGETYVRCEDVEQIPEILKSDKWRVVGPAGRRMVQERHTVAARASEIAGLYKESIL
jgi:hypothetical protein